MAFTLHPNLEKKVFISDLPLCRILLEDEKHYPWLFLVPRVEDISRMMDLACQDQMQLIKEIDFVQKVMWKAFYPDQLNVAAIGNKTPQLHIHVIARFATDPAWPGTVWDHSARMRYDEEQKKQITDKLKELLSLPEFEKNIYS